MRSLGVVARALSRLAAPTSRCAAAVSTELQDSCRNATLDTKAAHGWPYACSFSAAAADGSPSSSSGSRSGTEGSGSGSSASHPPLQQPEQQQQSGSPSPSPSSTVNQREAEKFAALAGEWWDPAGPFAPLHAMNPVRCRFLRAALCSAFGRDAAQAAPLAGLRLLDVGCGGGLLAESLARMGAHVTGVDVNEGGIATAVAHAARDPDLAGRLHYRAATAEQLVEEGQLFDAVIASEVIEHVASLPAFCAALDALTRPGGGVAVSTLNRTPRSYALAILVAEHLLRWVPPGTHDWDRFVRPEELAMQMEESTAGLRMTLLSGMQLNPLTRSWSLERDTAVNYIAFFAKPPVGNHGGDDAAGPAGRGQ